MVFGPEQTINSANYLLIHAMDKVRRLPDPGCTDIYLEEMRNLFIGQSFDLYWTRQGECPSEDEYLNMIRQSMSPLHIEIEDKLIICQKPAVSSVYSRGLWYKLRPCGSKGMSNMPTPPFKSNSCPRLEAYLTSLSSVLGEFFQIRDDYKNLTDEV